MGAAICCSIREVPAWLRSSKGSGHERRYRQEFHRPDRKHRVGLSQQQPDARFRNSGPDQPDSRRLAAGLGRTDRDAAETGQARGFRQKVDDPRLPDMSRGRQAVQIAETPFADPIQHDAGAIPGQMGPSGRLSDGGAELRGGTLAARQENGTWPAAAAAKIARNISWTRASGLLIEPEAPASSLPLSPRERAAHLGGVKAPLVR